MINDPSVSDRYTPFQLVRYPGRGEVSDKLLIVTFKLISIVLSCRAETENHLLNRETNVEAFTWRTLNGWQEQMVIAWIRLLWNKRIDGFDWRLNSREYS